jgi:hypothetical protein
LVVNKKKEKCSEGEGRPKENKREEEGGGREGKKEGEIKWRPFFLFPLSSIFLTSFLPFLSLPLSASFLPLICSLGIEKLL